jgi:hypothetical protein
MLVSLGKLTYPNTANRISMSTNFDFGLNFIWILSLFTAEFTFSVVYYKPQFTFYLQWMYFGKFKQNNLIF